MSNDSLTKYIQWYMGSKNIHRLLYTLSVIHFISDNYFIHKFAGKRLTTFHRSISHYFNEISTTTTMNATLHKAVSASHAHHLAIITLYAPTVEEEEDVDWSFEDLHAHKGSPAKTKRLIYSVYVMCRINQSHDPRVHQSCNIGIAGLLLLRGCS